MELQRGSSLNYGFSHRLQANLLVNFGKEDPGVKEKLCQPTTCPLQLQGIYIKFVASPAP